MMLSYKKLWKLLIDKDILKTQLSKSAGISMSSIAKLGRGENVNTNILVQICKALDCDVCDIVEIESRQNNEVKN